MSISAHSLHYIAKTGCSSCYKEECQSCLRGEKTFVWRVSYCARAYWCLYMGHR